MNQSSDPRHLREDDFRDLATGKASGAEVLGRVLEHLAERCAECRATLSEYPRRHLLERLPGSYREAIEEAVEAGSERAIDHLREHEEALPLVRELDPPRPLPLALSLVTSTPRFHRWGVVTRLSDTAQGLLYEDPEAAVYWSSLAVAAALAMEPVRSSEEVLETLRGAARVGLARALARSPERIADAEDQLARAAEHYERSTHNPRLLADIALARAEIPMAGRSAGQMLGDLRGMEGRLGIEGHEDLALRYLELMAVGFRAAGHLDAALTAFRSLLEAVGDSPLALSPADRHRVELELVETQLEAGRYEEAWALLIDDRGLLRKAGGPRERAARQWFGAFALAGFGRSAEASALLRSARQELLDEGAGLAAATMLLDELALRLEGISDAEQQELVAEISRCYTAGDLPPWARPPLIRLQRLGWRGPLTRQDVEEGRRALRAGPPEPPKEAPDSSEVVH